MDQRLFQDYLGRYWRWWPFYFFAFLMLGGMGYSPHGYEWTPIYVAAISGRWERLDTQTLRVLRTLPLSARTIAATAWCASVGFPLVLALCGLLFGSGLQSSFDSSTSRDVLWPDLRLFCVAATLLSAKFLGDRSVSGSTGRTWKGIGMVMIAFGFFTFISTLASWDKNPSIQTIILIGAIPMTVLSYLVTTKARENAEVLRKSYPTLEQRGDRARIYGTVGWQDVVLGNPFGAVLAGALLMLVACWLLWIVQSLASGFSPRGILHHILATEALLPFIMVIILFLSAPWITSMRAFGPLPISRRNLALAVVALPIIASLPLAPFAGPLALAGSYEPIDLGLFLASNLAFLGTYLLVLGIVLFVDALLLYGNLKYTLDLWERFPVGCTAAMVACVLLFPFVFTRHIINAFFDLWPAIALVTGLVLIITSVLWTYRLVAFRSEPYRPQKPVTLPTLIEKSE